MSITDRKFAQPITVATIKDPTGVGSITVNTSGAIIVPNATDTLVAKNTTDILTNKTISTASNTINGLTANRALQSDGAGVLSVSAVTSTELGYVAGVTSAIQPQFGNKANVTLNNLGVTALNASLTPDADTTYDIGSTSNRFAVGYFQELSDSLGQVVLDTENRIIYSNDGSQAIKFEAADILVSKDIIPDTDDTYSVGSASAFFADTFTTNLHSSNINTKSDNSTSIDVDNRQLIDSGANNIVDWENKQLRIAGGNLRVDWGNSRLKTASTTKLDWSGTDISVNNRRIEQLQDPISAQQAATKFYVDNLVGGLSWKKYARAASVADVDISSAPASIDGVSLTGGDRVLLKDQAAPEQNGIYDFNGAGNPLTRSSDADTWTDLVGSVLLITEGSVNTGAKFVNQNIDGGVLDTDPVNFTAFSIAGTVNGTGTANYVAYWSGVSTLTAEQFLSPSRGGLGADASGFTGVVKSVAGVFSASSIVNADIDASANIAFSKLAPVGSGQILVGNVSNVATPVVVTGDIAITNAGVTSYQGVVPINKGGTNNSSAYSAGSLIYSDGVKLAEDNANLYYDATGKKLGIASGVPSFDLTIGSGSSDKTIGMNRSAAGNGGSLSVRAADAESGSTDSEGGIITFQAGIGTGAGGPTNVDGASFIFQSPLPDVSGTADQTLYNNFELYFDGSFVAGNANSGGSTLTYDGSANSMLFSGTSSPLVFVARPVSGPGVGLTVRGGRAATGATNADGGGLTLRSGNPTGNGQGLILFQTQGGGASGTADNNTNTRRMSIDGGGDVIVGTFTTALATNATSGFLFVPAMAGTPTGGPNAITSSNAITIDKTNDKLYWFTNGAWHAAGSGSGSVTSVATGTGLTGGPITTTGTISLADTAVTPGSYGSASSVATFTVDQQGRLTTAASVSISIDASAITSGTLPVVRGGTGQSSYTDGQLLIGNSSGNTLTKSTLTAGSGISITNGNGSITITSSSVSSGDLPQTSFSGANNQSSPANVTGFAFANGSVRSFQALVSVAIDATADVFEVFELNGVQRGADWALSYDSTGDTSGYAFSITTAGQIQYTSTNLAGFVSSTVKFRAIVTNV